MAYVFYLTRSKDDVSKLQAAWSNPETFVFLQEHGRVHSDWIEGGMASLPDNVQKGHFCLLTSGTTGQPKLIVGCRERAERLTFVLHDLQELEDVEETILVLPLSYCYAFVNQWLWSIAFKRSFIYTSGFSDPEMLKKALDKADKAMLCLVASQVPLFTKHFGNNTSFSGIIRLNFAGSPFPQNKIKEIHDIFPNAKIFNNYGCAEAMPRLTIRPEEISSDGSNVGKLLPGIFMKIDEAGRILFKSKYSAVGFYEHNKYSSIKDEDWIPSGDLGEEIEGGYWRISGRSDEIFKRFGEKISIPQLFKTVYANWNGEASFYRERDNAGEEGYILVLSPEPKEDEYRNVLSAFRKNYSRAHWPIRLESVESFPLLGNGKIDKSSLMSSNKKVVHWYQRS